MSSAFYVPEGGEFVSSELTRGPWDPGSQHAGPPAALIARELERTAWSGAGTPGREAEDVTGVVPFIGRITFEVLRPVPIAPLRVETRVVRPGRSVELLEATLLDRSGEALVRALAWRLAERPTEIPPDLPRPDPVPGPDEAEEKPFFDTGWDVGYHTAMEYRFVAGSFRDLGPATVWMRMRHPLVAGEQPTPLQRVLAAADSGNGVSATLDLASHIFINVDLSVHLHRLPAGEWVCLDAITLPEPNGVGLADTALHDERGPIGRALQTLLVRERDLA
jgi:hypothetical protein